MPAMLDLPLWVNMALVLSLVGGSETTAAKTVWTFSDWLDKCAEVDSYSQFFFFFFSFMSCGYQFEHFHMI